MHSISKKKLRYAWFDGPGFRLLNNAQLKLRLKTLLDRKKVMQGRNVSASKISASFITLEEGFQQFGSDLNKLQVALSLMMLLPAN